MKYLVNINGIDVEAFFDEASVENIFKPLLTRLANIRSDKGGRVLVMIAAPPGAGKSTLVSFLEYLAKDINLEYKVQAIGMDGFHRRQEFLTSHTINVEGKEVSMVDVKGCPETFDLDKLVKQINVVLNIDVCTWPSYDRHLHNPIEDTITIDGDIILLEGNYLLLDKDGWDSLSDMADYTISIKAEENLLRERLIDRKEKSGNTREKAEEFVNFSDMRNVRLCLEHIKSADLELVIDKNAKGRGFCYNTVDFRKGGSCL